MPEVEWLDQPDGTERTRRTRPLLLLAASLPWLLVAGLLILPGRGAPTEGGPTAAGRPTDASTGDASTGDASSDDEAGAETDGPADRDHPTASDATAPPDPSSSSGPTASTAPGRTPRPTSPPGTEVAAPPDLELDERRGRWRIAPGIEEAAALAVVVARAWLTGLHPVLPVDGVPPPAPDGYAEHLVVEAVEQPGADAAVITVVGIVLGGEDLEASVRRVAVPLVLRPDGPRVAGPPWELPAPSLDPDEPERHTIDDPDERLAASEALVAAGLDEHTLVALHDTPTWAVIAEVEVLGQDDTSSVWLRRHQGGFVVSGTAMTPDAGGDEGAEGAVDARGDGNRDARIGADGASRPGGNADDEDDEDDQNGPYEETSP